MKANSSKLQLAKSINTFFEIVELVDLSDTDSDAFVFFIEIRPAEHSVQSTSRLIRHSLSREEWSLRGD